jgi:hypothetical protein
VARAIAIFRRDLIKPQTTEYGCEDGRESPDEESCLFSEHSVRGNYKWDEVTALRETGLEVLQFLLSFMLS